MGCVYMLTAPSGKKYIGITSRPIEERWKGHQKKSSNCLLVKRAIDKYGWDKIKKEILLYCQDDQLEYYEKKFIDLYDSLAPNGMNCTSGGETNKQLSNNTKTNISTGLQQFYRENKHRGKFKYMTLADKKKANGGISYNRNTYCAIIPMSWNNGKQKRLYFKTRELAQAAIEEWRSKLIQ
jgi:ribosomal protein S24E